MKEVVVFQTWDEPHGLMALDFLREEGLHPRYTSPLRSTYPLTMDGLGEISIRVPEDEVERALEIIEARFSGPEMEEDEEPPIDEEPEPE